MRTKKSPKRANIARINFVAVRPLLALASDKVEREDVFLNVNVVAYASMLA